MKNKSQLFIYPETNVNITNLDFSLNTHTTEGTEIIYNSIMKGFTTRQYNNWVAYNFTCPGQGAVADTRNITDQSTLYQDLLTLEQGVEYICTFKITMAKRIANPFPDYIQVDCGDSLLRVTESGTYSFYFSPNPGMNIVKLTKPIGFTCVVDYISATKNSLVGWQFTPVLPEPAWALTSDKKKLYLTVNNVNYTTAALTTNQLLPYTNYVFEYSVSGANANMEHFVVLGTVASGKSYGNGIFKKIIKTGSTATSLKVVCNNNVILPSESFADPVLRRINIYGLKVSSFVENEIELYDNESIPLTFQIADIQDITKRSTTFSKTVVLPGTQWNNKVLKHSYRVENDYSFKLNTPVRATLKENSIDIFKGYLYLQNITLSNEDTTIEYEADLRSEINSLFKSTSEKYLRGNDNPDHDIDFSEWNHKYTYPNIRDSWWKGSEIKVGYNYLPTMPSTNNELGKGFVYPLIDYGYPNSNMSVEDMGPAIFVKELFDKIVSKAGFNYTSTFLNSDRFKRLIMPKLAPIQSSASSAAKRGGIYDSHVAVNGHSSEFMSKFSVWHTSYLKPAQLLNPYKVPLKRIDGLNGINNYITSVKGKYTIAVKAQDIRFTVKLRGGSISSIDVNPRSNSSSSPTMRLMVYLKIKNPSGAIQTLKSQEFKPEDSINNGSFTITANPKTFFSTPDTKSSTGNYVMFDVSGVVLEAGTEIFIETQFESKHYNASGDWMWQRFFIIPYNTDYVECGCSLMSNSLEMQVKSESGLVFEGDTMEMNQILPLKGLKQSEFLQSIIKMFNLYISSNPNNANNLLIDPRDTFYSGGSIVDWSQKRDFDAKFLIEQASDLQNQNISFKWTEDSDTYNQVYTDCTEKQFGENYIKADITTLETFEIKPGFAPTPMDKFVLDTNANAIQCPVIYKKDSNNKVIASTFKPRILYWGGIQYWDQYNTAARWNFKHIDESNPTKIKTHSYGTFDRSNWYPYAGFVDKPLNGEETFDLNFGLNYWYWPNGWPSGGLTSNNLVELYYKNMLSELSSPLSKKVTGYFYLTGEDMFKFNWKNAVLIDGVYYRINKIFDYVPNKITKVELLKLISEDLPIAANEGRYNPRGNYRHEGGVTVTSNNGGFIPNTITNQPWNYDTDLITNPDATFDTSTSYISTTASTNNTFNGYGIVIMDGAVGNNIQGDNIEVGENVTNSTVTGSNNVVIEAGLTNVTVINTDNITVTESNTTYVNGQLYVNGIQRKKIDIIDGGHDEVQYMFSPIVINVVDGGFNINRSFNTNEASNVIDGNVF